MALGLKSWKLPVTFDRKGKPVSLAEYVKAVLRERVGVSDNPFPAPDDLAPSELNLLFTRRWASVQPSALVAGFIGYGYLTAAECLRIADGTLWNTDEALKNAVVRFMRTTLKTELEIGIDAKADENGTMARTAHAPLKPKTPPPAQRAKAGSSRARRRGK